MGDIDALLASRSGIKLDICCGANKQGADWVGIDIQELPGVDIVWDINVHPWPLPDECVTVAVASHVLEHIPKVVIDNGRTRWPFIEVMNEIWRVMKPGGQFLIAVPHGASPGFLQDPTHAAPINEYTFHYFDPEASGGLLYNFYRPKPWQIKVDERGEPLFYFDPAANMEIVLVKRAETHA
jgi:SAM-dependent methyltransferase